MVMQIVQASRRSCGLFAWFNFERRTWLAVVACAALAGYWAGNGHTTQDAIQSVSQKLGVKTVQVKTLASVAGCQQKRADIAEGKIGAADTASGLLPCPDVGQALKRAESATSIPALPK